MRLLRRHVQLETNIGTRSLVWKFGVNCEPRRYTMTMATTRLQKALCRIGRQRVPYRFSSFIVVLFYFVFFFLLFFFLAHYDSRVQAIPRFQWTIVSDDVSVFRAPEMYPCRCVLFTARQSRVDLVGIRVWIYIYKSVIFGLTEWCDEANVWL